MGYKDINLSNLGGGSGGSGVTSLNTQIGDLTLVAGTNITITPGSGTLTFSDSGSGFTFPIIAPGGTVTAPSYAFSETSDDTGMWSSTDGQIDWSNNASLGMSLDPSHNLIVVGNITAANFPVIGNVNSFAMYDGAGALISDLGYEYDPTHFNGLRYSHNVVPDNSNNFSLLHNVFASYNPTAPADETWNQFFIEAGVATDNSGFKIGDYTDVKSTLVFQDITYTSRRTGTDGDIINIEYTGGGTAGSEVVTSPSSFTYVIQIESGVSTATQIVAAIDNSSNPGNIKGSINYVVTGVGSNPQTTGGPSFLTGGANALGSLNMINVNLYNRNTSNMGNGNGFTMGYDFGNGTDPIKANKFLAYGGNMFIHDNATVQAASAFEYGFSTGNIANSIIEGDLRGVNIYGNPQTIVQGVIGYQLGLNIDTAQYVEGFTTSVHAAGNITQSVNAYSDFSNYDGDIGDNYFGIAIQPNINTTDGFFGVNVGPNVTLSRFNSYGINVNMQNVTPFAGTFSTLVIQDITYTAQAPGTGLNGVTIEYVSDTTAGNETAVLVGNAVTVHMENSVSTATQIRTAVLANVVIAANVSVTITGVGSNPQLAAGPQPLAGGTDGSTIYSGEFTNGQFHVGNGRFIADYVLDTANGAPQQVFNINDLNSGFKVSAGFPMTGGQFGAGNSLSGAVQIEDNVGPDITGFHLGYSMAGILTEIEVAAGKTMDALNFISCGAGIGSGSGNITNVTFYRTLGLLPEGGTLTVTNQYGFKVDSLFTSSSPTNAWGFYCADTNADNWFAKNVVIGGSTGHATGAYALDVIGNVIFDGFIYSTDTNQSIDSNARNLISPAGNNVVLWNIQLLADDAGNDSLNWGVRHLQNSSGNVTLDWDAGFTQDATGQASIDWSNRILSDSSATPVFNWSTTPSFLTEFFATIETFTNQTTPATPAAGKVTIFVDSADKHTKQIDETGTVIDLTDGALGTVTSVNGQVGVVVLTPTDIAYTPTTSSDWTNVPADEQQALDELAANKAYGKPLSAAVTLIDNTASPTTFLTFSKTAINNSLVQYSISRNGDFRTGTFYIANNSTVVSFVDNSTETASVGITFTAVIAGANVELQYTSTSTGFNAAFKHIRQQWA